VLTKKSLLLSFFIGTIALGQERDHWYLFRMEINAGRSSEIGLGAGAFWSFSTLEIPPCDAFGFTAGAAALLNKKETVPVFRLGAGANWGIVCGRVRYNLYKPSHGNSVSSINPQVGVTWLSIINLYVGYDQPLFKRTLPGVGGINASLCMNVPSYCFSR
jgi:hypothetical protein